MEKANIDKIIKEKLDQREMEPSSSAWDRLEVQLDERDQKNKTKRNYFTYIASGIILISLGYGYFKSTKSRVQKETISLASRGLSIINELPSNEIVKVDQIIIEKLNENIELIDNKNKIKIPNISKIDSTLIINKLPLASKDLTKDTVFIKKPSSNEQKSRIIVKGEDLLYSVTHSSEEVKNYYVRNKIDRESVIDSIKVELRKRKLKISPEKILAQVEYEILDDQFKGNFMQKIKLKISDIAIALADRNRQ